jgi:hypothetical protein
MNNKKVRDHIAAFRCLCLALEANPRFDPDLIKLNAKNYAFRMHVSDK